MGLPDERCALLRSWLRPSEGAAPSRPNRSPRDTDLDRTVVFGPESGDAAGGNYRVLCALYVGLVRRDPPDCDGWLRLLREHLESPETSRVWKSLGPRLISVLRATDLTAAEQFIDALFERHPSVRDSTSGAKLIAAAMHRLPHSAIERWLTQLEGGSWARRGMATGELHMLLVTRSDASLAARHRVDVAMASDDVDLLSGLASGAARLWATPGRRPRAHEVLIQIAKTTTGRAARAAMAVFSICRPFAYDQQTLELLSVVAERPDLLREADAMSVVERLRELMPGAARPVSEVAGALVASVGNSPAPGALAAQSPVLLEIALTLQRLGEPWRTRGLEIFEQLLRLDAYGVREALARIDEPPTSNRGRLTRSLRSADRRS